MAATAMAGVAGMDGVLRVFEAVTAHRDTGRRVGVSAPLSPAGVPEGMLALL